MFGLDATIGLSGLYCLCLFEQLSAFQRTVYLSLLATDLLALDLFGLIHQDAYSSVVFSFLKYKSCSQSFG